MSKQLATNNSACNYIYKELQNCYKEYPVKRFTGCCSPIYLELQRCIQVQQNLREEQSLKRSKEMQKRMRAGQQKDN